jgi:hypothetical protein
MYPSCKNALLHSVQLPLLLSLLSPFPLNVYRVMFVLVYTFIFWVYLPHIRENMQRFCLSETGFLTMTNIVMCLTTTCCNFYFCNVTIFISMQWNKYFQYVISWSFNLKRLRLFYSFLQQ